MEQQRSASSRIIIPAIVVVIVLVGAGAWYLVGRGGNKIVANANQVTNTQNTNTTADQTTLYQGDGFSVRYPSDWVSVNEPSGQVGLRPKNATYVLEGSVDYPINIAGGTDSAEKSVEKVATDRKQSVTMNGHTGFRVLDYGDKDYYYVFTLASGRSVSIISRIHLVQTPSTRAPTIDQLLADFDQIVSSLRLNSVTNLNTPNQNTNVASTNEAGNTLFFTSSKYGFSLKYPKQYEYFTGSNPNINLLYNWGINAEQELLFSVVVYPVNKESEAIQYNKIEISSQTNTIGGKTAHLLTRGGLYSVEANGYFYVIDSLFPDITNAQDKKNDYLSILDSLTFFSPR